MVSIKILLFSFVFFNLIFLIKTEEEIIENLNYTSACEYILIVSKKDCSVAPRSNNQRCCYVSWKNGEADSYTGKNGRCYYIEDTKKALKAFKNNITEGHSNVKIECKSFYNKFLLFLSLSYIILML